MVREIERHHDDQELARLIAALEQYLERAVIALVVADRDGELSIAGPVGLPVITKIADALHTAGVERIDA